ncbi:MAG: hypothetical protein FJX25_10265 [Alphaproteobacteria bacterium]|nr:hypothetical protein [Alphaproteobacteria bacterium]
MSERNDAVVDPLDQKNGRLSLHLRAKSGFESEGAEDVSPNQWEAINLIIHDAVDASDVIALANGGAA